MTDIVLANPRHRRYDDATYQEAFHLWMLEANRSYALTARMLRDRFTIEARATGEPPRPAPDETTLHDWATRDNWPGKAHDLLTTNGWGGQLYRHAIGQAILLLPKQLEGLGTILALDLDDAANRRDFLKASQQLTEILHNHIVTASADPKLGPGKRAATTPRTDRAEVAADQRRRIQALKAPRKGPS